MLEERRKTRTAGYKKKVGQGKTNKIGRRSEFSLSPSPVLLTLPLSPASPLTTSWPRSTLARGLTLKVKNTNHLVREAALGLRRVALHEQKHGRLLRRRRQDALNNRAGFRRLAAIGRHLHLLLRLKVRVAPGTAVRRKLVRQERRWPHAGGNRRPAGGRSCLPSSSTEREGEHRDETRSSKWKVKLM